MNDGELESCIARAATGETDALRRLYDELGGAVFALARAITGDERLAQDVLQDVFVKAYAAANRYRAHGKPRAWLMRIARNEALTALRRKKREAPAETWVFDGENNAAQAWPDRVDIHRALSTLAPPEREIVLLNVLGGLTHREVAKLLGIPSGSVSWRYRAAIGKLRDCLSGVDR